MKKHPRFKRPDVDRFPRLRDVWRKPRGIDSKQRVGLRYAGAKPKIGYRTPKALRGLRAGLKEVLVANPREVGKAGEQAKQAKAGEKIALKIASGVGAKKKALIAGEAKKLGLRVLNP